MQTTILIEVDGRDFETQERALFGAQIKTLAKKPAGNVLYRVDGRHPVEIGDTELIHLHEREKFVTQPPVGGAS